MACTVCKGECRHADLVQEAADISLALAHVVESKSLRFALVMWDESGFSLLSSNAHQATVRHQLAKTLSAELEEDFRELAERARRAESEAH